MMFPLAAEEHFLTRQKSTGVSYGSDREKICPIRLEGSERASPLVMVDKYEMVYRACSTTITRRCRSRRRRADWIGS